MLTPTDIHYLVGVLSSVGQPDDVELELGSRVKDETTGEERDVDITMVTRGATGREAFRAIEVKAEKRPMDVIGVEQLCAKLNDMPDLTARAIVSASGYYDPARRKAEAHGVELLRLDDWDRERQPFGGILPPNFTMENRDLQWDQVFVNFAVDWRGHRPVPIANRSRVTDRGGQRIGGIPDLQALSQHVARQVAEDHRGIQGVEDAKAGQLMEVNRNVLIGDKPLVQSGRLRFEIVEAQVSGRLVWRSTRVDPKFKILVRDRDDTPYIACLVTEGPDNGLLGFAIRGVPSPLTLFRIPLSDRNKKQILRQGLR